MVAASTAVSSAPTPLDWHDSARYERWVPSRETSSMNAFATAARRTTRPGSSVRPERLPCKQRPSPVRIRPGAQPDCDECSGSKCRSIAASMSSIVARP